MHPSFGNTILIIPPPPPPPRYGASWSCGDSTCSGVQIQFTQYDDSVDYYSISDDDKNNRASSILEINLYNPSDCKSPDQSLARQSLVTCVTLFQYYKVYSTKHTRLILIKAITKYSVPTKLFNLFLLKC